MSMTSGPPKRVICTARMSRRLGAEQGCTDIGLHGPTRGSADTMQENLDDSFLRALSKAKFDGRRRAAGYAASAGTARSAVDVGAVRDAHDSDEDLVVVDGVDHAVLAPPCGPVALEFEAQRLADAVRVRGERPVQEVDDRHGHRLGEVSLDGPLGSCRENNGVGVWACHWR